MLKINLDFYFNPCTQLIPLAPAKTGKGLAAVLSKPHYGLKWLCPFTQRGSGLHPIASPSVHDLAGRCPARSSLPLQNYKGEQNVLTVTAILLLLMI